MKLETQVTRAVQSRTPQRPPWSYHPHQCLQWRAPGDTHGRDINPESTSAVHSAAQTQPPTLPPLIMAS